MIVKENTNYLAGTKLREGGMVEIHTSKIIKDKISISIWSIKNGSLLNLGDKNIVELEEMLIKDGFQILETI